MTLHRGDMRDVLPALPSDSVQLVLTSPPYNCGWDYAGADNDRLALPDYQALLRGFLAEALRVTRPGGVLAVNLPQTIQVYSTFPDGLQYRPDPAMNRMGRKRKPPKPDVRAYPIAAWTALEIIAQGWLPRETIIWVKSKGDVEVRATSTAIGAYSNPWLRPCHEVILLASKDTYRVPERDGRWPGEGSTWGAYLEMCKDVWGMNPGQAKAGEPLAFPDELVSRLVKLYSNPGDVVLDPFAGQGTTARMARLLSREAWLIEREPSYWARLEAVLGQQVMFEVSA